MLDKIVESCRFLLNHYPPARPSKSYLDSRLSAASQDLFRFGYFPGVQDLPALIDLVGEEALLKEGFVYSKEIEDSLFPRKVLSCYFEDHSLIMPFRNPYGQSVGLIGRTFCSEKEQQEKNISKYKNTKESSYFKKGNMVFGVYENKQSILDHDCVYIVEGQFDVIKAIEIGFTNIVALGTSSMTPYQFSVISRYSNNLFLLLDNDFSGQKGRKRIISKYGQMANIRNFYLPDDFKDIDEYITRGGISSFEGLSFSVKD